ncbi:hypothetical protein ACFQ3Z_06520 [Streptomyces nogalater]
MHRRDRPALGRRRHRPTAAQAEALALLAADTSAWLSWYHRSVLLDALEHLHGALTHTGR